MDVYALVSRVMAEIRRAKQGRSLRTPVAQVTITAPESVIRTLKLAEGDIRRAGNVAHIEWIVA